MILLHLPSKRFKRSERCGETKLFVVVVLRHDGNFVFAFFFSFLSFFYFFCSTGTFSLLRNKEILDFFPGFPVPSLTDVVIRPGLVMNTEKDAKIRIARSKKSCATLVFVFFFRKKCPILSSVFFRIVFENLLSNLNILLY